MFPITEEEFALLESQGKKTEGCETDAPDIIPEGENWEFWSMRITPEESKAVWRRIVTAE